MSWLEPWRNKCRSCGVTYKYELDARECEDDHEAAREAEARLQNFGRVYQILARTQKQKPLPPRSGEDVRGSK